MTTSRCRALVALLLAALLVLFGGGNAQQQPTSQPTQQPTTQPSTQPSAQPTRQPTTQPSAQPTRQPTTQPSRQPTRQPTSQPTRQPSTQPTIQPSSQPSKQPRGAPTSRPSHYPSSKPSTPSSQPTRQPTRQPTQKPTHPPPTPTLAPSAFPTVAAFTTVAIELDFAGVSLAAASSAAFTDVVRTFLAAELNRAPTIFTVASVTASPRRSFRHLLGTPPSTTVAVVVTYQTYNPSCVQIAQALASGLADLQYALSSRGYPGVTASVGPVRTQSAAPTAAPTVQSTKYSPTALAGGVVGATFAVLLLLVGVMQCPTWYGHGGDGGGGGRTALAARLRACLRGNGGGGGGLMRVFIAHDCGTDTSGRRTIEQAAKVAAHLTSHGYMVVLPEYENADATDASAVCGLKSDPLGALRAMQRLDTCAAVVCLLTDSYVATVGGGAADAAGARPEDPVYQQFHAAEGRKGSARLAAVVQDAALLSRAWYGPLAKLRSQPFAVNTGGGSDVGTAPEAGFEAAMKQLHVALRGIQQRLPAPPRHAAPAPAPAADKGNTTTADIAVPRVFLGHEVELEGSALTLTQLHDRLVHMATSVSYRHADDDKTATAATAGAVAAFLGRREERTDGNAYYDVYLCVNDGVGADVRAADALAAALRAAGVRVVRSGQRPADMTWRGALLRSRVCVGLVRCCTAHSPVSGRRRPSITLSPPPLSVSSLPATRSRAAFRLAARVEDNPPTENTQLLVRDMENALHIHARCTHCQRRRLAYLLVVVLDEAQRGAPEANTRRHTVRAPRVQRSSRAPPFPAPIEGGEGGGTTATAAAAAAPGAVVDALSALPEGGEEEEASSPAVADDDGAPTFAVRVKPVPAAAPASAVVAVAPPGTPGPEAAVGEEEGGGGAGAAERRAKAEVTFVRGGGNGGNGGAVVPFDG